MRRTSLVLLTLLFAVFLSSCKAKEMFDQRSIAKDLKERGTTDLMKQVADDSYEPPADGRLTDAQVQMYLKVREHEKQIAKVARQELEQHAKKAKDSGEKSLAGLVAGFKAAGSFADVFTADLRAAKDLGYNTAEYSWVKQQVLEASGAELGEKFAKGMGEMMDNAYAQTKAQHDATTDPQTKKMLSEALAGYEKGREEAKQVQIDPSVTYNRTLLARYEGPLNAIAAEMAKFEDQEGDAEKAIGKWAESLDKTTVPAPTDGNK